MAVINKKRGLRVAVAISLPFSDIEVRTREFGEGMDKSITLIRYRKTIATKQLFLSYLDQILEDIASSEDPKLCAKKWVDYLKDEWKKDEDSVTKPFYLKYKGENES